MILFSGWTKHSAVVAGSLLLTACYNVGGEVEGLNGKLSLQLNEKKPLAITQDGPFVFKTKLPAEQAFTVAVVDEPMTQSCTVTPEQDVMAEQDYMQLVVACVDKPWEPHFPPVANPNIDLTPPTELALAGPNQLRLNYIDPAAATREDAAADYASWSLHLWNNAACDAIAESALNTEWADQSLVPAGHDQYGPYWEMDLNKEFGCANVIIRDGSLSKLIDADLAISFDQFTDRTVSVIQGNSQIFDSREEAWNTNPPGLGIINASAHLVDANTLVWADAIAADYVRLYSSADGSFTVNSDGTVDGAYQMVMLEPGQVSDEAQAAFPHLDFSSAYQLPDDADLKSLLKGEVVAMALTAEGYVYKTTEVQFAGALDSLYAAANDDDVQLGVSPSQKGYQFQLWAPTAQSVTLQTYNKRKKAKRAYSMEWQADLGTWLVDTRVKHGQYYRYVVEVYHPASGEVETLEVTDPYSLSLATNSLYSQVVDLEHRKTKPAGWDSHVVPELPMTNMSIYEAHVRDFSAHDLSTSEENRGKYLAFTELDSAPMQHLAELKQAGLTHLHLLPAFDIATVEEDEKRRVEISDTVGKLCSIQPDNALCGVESNGAVIADLLEACDPSTQCTDDIVDSLRWLDGFNWGYDPFHFGAPEGSYASNPDGFVRIKEFRAMVQSVHEMGLRVAMDVVYNHTNASGLNDKSVLDKVVPGYYQRRNAITGAVETSTCCDNTATEHAMMAKLMKDTLVIWTRDYGIDAFRFDLMGHQPLAAMEESLAAVKAADPDNYFYGEGWNFGEVQNDARFVQATQLNLAGTGIGSFSDRMRDVVRGGSPFDSAEAIRGSQGLANGLFHDPNELNASDDATKLVLLQHTDIARVELAGLLSSFKLIDANDQVVTGSEVDYNGQPAGYTASPLEAVSYVSKHDNQTLWDINQYKLPSGMSPSDRVRAQSFALSFPLLGQGVPFIHMGSDVLRSKSMERDSYDSGDWYNKVDFTAQDNNWNVGLPRYGKDGLDGNYPLIGQIIADPSTDVAAGDIAQAKAVFNEYLALRNATPLIGLGSAEAINARVDYHNMGSAQTPGLILMSVNDGVGLEDLDANYDAILIAFNAGADLVGFDTGIAGLELHPSQVQSVDSVLASASVNGTAINVPAYSTVVFVLPQGNEQGVGIPVTDKYDPAQPTFGDTVVYLRGSMNGWSTDNPLEYVYDGEYSALVELVAGSYEFKFADADWGGQGVNYGGFSAVVAQGSLPIVTGADNLSVTIAEDGQYLISFAVDKADPSIATVSITSQVEEAPYGDTAVLLRGDMNGWDESLPFSYIGGGIYSQTLNLAAGDHGFKLASADWSTVNLGGGLALVAGGESVTLQPGSNDNLSLSVATSSDYTFTLNASDIAAPSLSVSFADVGAVCSELATVSEDGPLAEALAIRGENSDWAWDAAYAFSHKGNGLYQAVADFSGTFMFKLATDDWGTQYFVVEDDSLIELETDVEYLAVSGDAGLSNNSITLSEGRYAFNLDVSGDQATLNVCEIGTVKTEIPEPVVADGKAVISFVDAESPVTDPATKYASWSLYIWNDASCSAADPSMTLDWADQSIAPAGVDEYGPYWEVDLATLDGCFNYIIRDGALNKVVEADLQLNLNNYPERAVAVIADGREYATRQLAFQGYSEEPEYDYLAFQCAAEDQAKFNDLRIYQVMTEAFIDGDSNADYGTGYGSSHHKGDLQGIIDSLDYIQSLGMNAVWLTPVFETVVVDGQEHWIDRLDATGYFATNYFNIDPNFGDMQLAKTLVDEAHARGMYVFFDGVFGHFKSNAQDYASPNGLAVTETGPAQGSLGRRSEYPEDLAFFKEVAKFWIEELKIDGWRLDQAYQVPVGAWGEIRQAVTEASQGVSYQMNGETVNPLGYMVAEIWSGEDQIAETGYGTDQQHGLCSAFDFPGRYRVVQNFAAQENGSSFTDASTLAGVFDTHAAYPEHAIPNLMITNHDLVRFGDLLQRAGIAEPTDAEYWQRHKAAYAFLAAYTGPITLYYGDEIGDEVADFAQAVDCNNDGGVGAIAGLCDDHVSRSSGKVEGLASEQGGEVFTANAQQAELRDYIAELMQLRANYPALSQGERLSVLSVGDLYADMKSLGEQQVLYIANMAATTELVEIPTTFMGLSNYNTFQDLQSDDQYAFVGGMVEIELAPFEAKFLLVGGEEPAQPYSETVYLRGDLNGWDTSLAFEFVGADSYHVSVTFPAGTTEFKIADANWANLNFGAGVDGGELEAASFKTLASGGGNLSITLEEATPLVFILQADDPANPVLIVEADLAYAPYQYTAVYLRGDMNGWAAGPDSQMLYHGSGKYEITVQLDAQTYLFKLADPDWTSINLGGGTETLVNPGLPLQLFDGGANLSFTPAVAGSYDFVLDASDPAAISLTVR